MITVKGPSHVNNYLEIINKLFQQALELSKKFRAIEEIEERERAESNDYKSTYPWGAYSETNGKPSLVYALREFQSFLYGMRIIIDFEAFTNEELIEFWNYESPFEGGDFYSRLSIHKKEKELLKPFLHNFDMIVGGAKIEIEKRGLTKQDALVFWQKRLAPRG